MIAINKLGLISDGSLFKKITMHLFELATSAVFFLVGINYMMDADAGKRSGIGETLHPFDYSWQTMYIVGAVFIFVGIFKTSQRFRVSGLTLMGTGLLMNFVAAITVDPLEARDFTFLVWSLACLLRALLAAETVIPVVTRRASR